MRLIFFVKPWIDFFHYLQIFVWYSEFKIMCSPSAPYLAQDQPIYLPRKLRPLSVSNVDQGDHSMFKAWETHLCAWILHLRKLRWHYSVFQNLLPSHPLYFRVPTINTFASFSLRPTCSFQREAQKKSFLHYYNQKVIYELVWSDTTIHPINAHHKCSTEYLTV